MIGFQKRRKIALGHFRNLDHRNGIFAWAKSFMRASMSALRADTAYTERPRVGAPAIGRNLYYVNGGRFDRILEKILQLPAHRGLEFRVRHVGRVQQLQLVIAAPAAASSSRKRSR